MIISADPVQNLTLGQSVISGGVIVYFRNNSLRDYIQLVELNSNGAVWFKLLKNRSDVEYDSYFCTCYIPSEESKVYKNPKSSLYEYDFLSI